jgi:processive 1,2-diacylglycerol beta-glucosyltransferase
MDYCDIIISKPGGLTVTESIVKNIPLVIPFAIPGQENENIDFLVGEGYCIHVKHIRDINNVVDNLINNPEELSKMRNKLKELADTYSLTEIVNISNKLISNSKKDDHL